MKYITTSYAIRQIGTKIFFAEDQPLFGPPHFLDLSLSARYETQKEALQKAVEVSKSWKYNGRDLEVVPVRTTVEVIEN